MLLTITMKYQPVPVPKDLIKTISETDPSDNKNQVNHFDSDHSIVWDDYSNNNNNNNNDDGWTHFNDEDNVMMN